MSLFSGFLFLLGLFLLAAGAELLVRGASDFALALGVSPLLVGLTIVAYSTSAPELAVTLSSAASGQANLAVGNIVGSNIFNILFILGLASILVPLIVARQLIRLDVPVMVGASVAMYVLGRDGNISRVDGAILFGGMLAYTAFLIYSVRQAKPAANESTEKKPIDWRKQIPNALFILMGVGLLVLGANLMVDSATVFARAVGVSDLVIGLTIVAIGTSLPEVAASLTASVRGQRDIAAGNAIGSNISNIMLVLGLAAMISPVGLPVPDAALEFDLPLMIGAALICLPVFFTGRMIARWEGAVLLVLYVLYAIYVFLSATNASIFSLFQTVLIFFVIPLVVLTLLGTMARAFWSERRRSSPE